jgi:hypothetical protein
MFTSGVSHFVGNVEVWSKDDGLQTPTYNRATEIDSVILSKLYFALSAMNAYSRTSFGHFLLIPHHPGG